MTTRPQSRLSDAIIRLICKKCELEENTGVSSGNTKGIYSDRRVGLWEHKKLMRGDHQGTPGWGPQIFILLCFFHRYPRTTLVSFVLSHQERLDFKYSICLVLKDTILLISLVLCPNFCLQKKKNNTSSRSLNSAIFFPCSRTFPRPWLEMNQLALHQAGVWRFADVGHSEGHCCMWVDLKLWRKRRWIKGPLNAKHFQRAVNYSRRAFLKIKRAQQNRSSVFWF